MGSIIDISLPVGPELVVWPGNPQVRITPASRLSNGDASNVSQLSLGTHSGTHVDPPSHFLEEGMTAEQLPLDALVGEAMVADLTGVDGSIRPRDLDELPIPPEVSRVLFKTRNSDRWHQPGAGFTADYVSLSVEGARWLVRRGIRLVGTDSLSIETYRAPGRPTHHVLLEAGVTVVEGLDLWDVAPGLYTLLCLPLKVAGGDGAPARAVLLAR
jgi:arylformamidase